MWTPKPERASQTDMARFMGLAGKRSYDELHAWSVAERGAFWNLLWEFCEVKGQKGARALVDGDRMPGALWFPDARLNFAENLLRSRDHRDAIVFWGEDRVKRRLSHRNLYDLVSRLSQALADAGLKKGDRVAGYLPNLPEATAAMLATASLGAVWSSCSPDFGVQGVLDRFGQIQPKVLFCADGYFYGGKEFDSQEKAAQVLEQLPSVEECVVIDYIGSPATAGTSLYDFLDPFDAGEIRFEPLEFNHPLYILYSSGTTGVPKCIVHGAGGTLLQHLKEHRLHSDVKPGDRLFYFTTLGWMMWNWLVSGLASEATLLLYDGSPFVERGRLLFDLADAEGMTHFGTSAKFIDSLAKVGLKPRETHRLEKLRAVLSTGSPLLPEGFDYVYRNIKDDVCLSSISGGTDAVLNPGGVRIGTAEIYRQVEQLDEIVESLVIGQDWAGDVRVVLFVKLREGLALDDALANAIKRRVRENTTPRHVPARILQVDDIPRTKSGKIVELAVRDVVHGRPVKNLEALANPEALEYFRDRAELRE